MIATIFAYGLEIRGIELVDQTGRAAVVIELEQDIDKLFFKPAESFTIVELDGMSIDTVWQAIDKLLPAVSNIEIDRDAHGKKRLVCEWDSRLLLPKLQDGSVKMVWL